MANARGGQGVVAGSAMRDAGHCRSASPAASPLAIARPCMCSSSCCCTRWVAALPPAGQ